MSKRILALSLVATGLLFSNCSKNENNETPAPAPTELTHANVIKNVTLEVIVATYKDMDEKAQLLKDAVYVFNNQSTEENLTKVKQAWAATRQAWEQSEGFLYGPASNKSLDPAMDSWPVDSQEIANIINGTAKIFEKDINEDGKIDDEDKKITVDVITHNADTRGFHLIEYLVWGAEGNKTAAQITDREKEYLVAATQDLKGNTNTLYEDWSVGKGDWASRFLKAGTVQNDPKIFPSYAAAYGQYVEGMVEIANEVTATKINDAFNPSGTPDISKEESRFSNNSTKDFADNIRSIQNVYLGQYQGKKGLGLSDAVAKGNAALDTKVKTAITEAIQAIEAMGVFSKAIFDDKAKVTAAQEKVAALRDLLDSELKAYVLTLK